MKTIKYVALITQKRIDGKKVKVLKGNHKFKKPFSVTKELGDDIQIQGKGWQPKDNYEEVEQDWKEQN